MEARLQSVVGLGIWVPVLSKLGFGPYYGGPYYGGYTSPGMYETPSYQYQYGGYGTEERQRPELCLKDGTIYSVTDYWLVDGLLHFTMPDKTGTKSVEQVIGFDELDLQKTIDVNTRRGFHFVLRNEPLQQYLEHHPDAKSSTNSPPQTVPTAKGRRIDRRA